ncbi:hypothetical protein D3C87_1185760 [compost metagenome]
MWVVFGVNFFLHFIPQPPPPDDAMKFLSGLMANPIFFPFMKVIEITFGVLLLANVAVPLALVVLAPITLNIFLYHVVLDPAGAGMAVAMVAIHVFLGYAYFNNFRPLFKRG